MTGPMETLETIGAAQDNVASLTYAAQTLANVPVTPTVAQDTIAG